jgi:CheY-like chemotaxis protein
MARHSGSLKGRRVIVTDDNTSKLTAVTETLRKAGLCVFAAYDGQSALELIAQLPDIDLLVTNTRLGNVDGPELMRRTREMRPDMAILHVIHDGASDGDTPLDVMNLREPFTPERLLTAVGALLR